jgi:N-acetylglucosaminyldiphosphoundecaprenol N-acetyl-beta-D-mannosaminyltransferase
LLIIGQRTFDLVLVIPSLILTSPIWIFVYFLGGRIGVSIKGEVMIGNSGKRFSSLRFDTTRSRLNEILRVTGLSRLPILFNILKGDLSWVGPLPLSLTEAEFLDSAGRGRFEVKPGLISLWWLRKRTNIDFGNETQIEREYIDSKSLLQDIGILLRGLLTLSYGSSRNTIVNEIEVLGIRIHNLNMNQALDRIEELLADRQNPAQISFVNPHCANLSYVDPDYSAVLKKSNLVLVDGIGMKIAGRILGFEISQNVNGTDLFPRLCARLEESGRSIFFLGADG